MSSTPRSIWRSHAVVRATVWWGLLLASMAIVGLQFFDESTKAEELLESWRVSENRYIDPRVSRSRLSAWTWPVSDVSGLATSTVGILVVALIATHLVSLLRPERPRIAGLPRVGRIAFVSLVGLSLGFVALHSESDYWEPGSTSMTIGVVNADVMLASLASAAGLDPSDLPSALREAAEEVRGLGLPTEQAYVERVLRVNSLLRCTGTITTFVSLRQRVSPVADYTWVDIDRSPFDLYAVEVSVGEASTQFRRDQLTGFLVPEPDDSLDAETRNVFERLDVREVWIDARTLNSGPFTQFADGQATVDPSPPRVYTPPPSIRLRFEENVLGERTRLGECAIGIDSPAFSFTVGGFGSGDRLPVLFTDRTDDKPSLSRDALNELAAARWTDPVLLPRERASDLLTDGLLLLRSAEFAEPDSLSGFATRTEWSCRGVDGELDEAVDVNAFSGVGGRSCSATDVIIQHPSASQLRQLLVLLAGGILGIAAHLLLVRSVP